MSHMERQEGGKDACCNYTVPMKWNLSCLYFSHVSCSHTFFSEEVPSRWNQSTFFSFRSLVGKSLFKDNRTGGSHWNWTAVGDDSVVYFDVFILLVSLSPFAALCQSCSTTSTTEQRKEKLCCPPVFLQLTC